MIHQGLKVTAALIGVSCAVSILSSKTCITLEKTSNQKRQKNNFLAVAATDATPPHPYVPASSEAYILEHAIDLGFNQGSQSGTNKWREVEMVSGCDLWKNSSLTSPEIYQQLHAFKNELDDYNNRLKNFKLKNITDIRHYLDDEGNSSHHEICNKLELHPGGLQNIFPSQQLSYTGSGYVEPLLPPLRHPKFCDDSKKFLLDLSYMIHDMKTMCCKLKRTSRIILIDMGASLSFHGNTDSPAIYLMELYRKFGMPFDHIYAFEMKQNDPKAVFDRVPNHWMAAYHWINVGVDSDPTSKFNPYNILDNFNNDDLIVVKLDIDTAAIEVPLAKQLLHDDRLKIIDQFYFEHHVFMKEISGNWGGSMIGTMQDSLELFSNIRKKGVAMHFWV